MRRITITADQRALETLRDEARRRGASLAILVREAVDEEVASMCAARRPRVALARSTDGRSAAAVTAEPPAY
jgi:hypothetical protein